uniref:Phosphatidylinositol glycan anchor biosynthesis class Y n=1 Tax=Cyprinus carpio TaxID=7962 RepID=A0A8C2FQ78_CYPCA
MSHALRRLATGVFSAQRSVSVRPLLRPVSAAKIQGPQRSRSDGVKDTESQPFDESLLEFLVCPLSRKPLRYDERSNELINEELVTVLVPLISLSGLFYSAAVDDNFPQGCTSASSVCFYSLLLPVTIPVYVFFHLWKWMGIKLFRHN